jgi:hypothetical protein
MALPKLDVPIFTLKLISNGKNVRFRPFSVKEEKIFLMANESDDSVAVIDAVKQVLNNCILDDIKIDTLPIFDIEYLFLNIRARSISEIVDLRYKCNNEVVGEDGEKHKCNNVVDLQLNVLDIQPVIDIEHTNKIEITENLGMVMRYPSFEMLEKYNAENEIDSIFDLTIGCIEYIYDKDEIYYAKDTTKQELIEFVESMQTKDLEKVKVFFDTLPKIKKKMDFKCIKCGYNEEIEIEGIESFFA